MEHHSDLDTPINNLTELLSMVERRNDDMYITSMKQYIVNPLAWFITEKAVRTANAMEKTGTTHNKARQCATQICPNAIEVPVVVEDRPGEKVAFVVCRTSGKLLPC